MVPERREPETLAAAEFDHDAASDDLLVVDLAPFSPRLKAGLVAVHLRE